MNTFILWCVDSTSSQQGTENRDPLPNPWAPGGTQNSGSTSRPASNTTSNVLGSPGMQSMFQQLSENPQLLSNINTPFVQSMMQTLAANPDFTSRVSNLSNSLILNYHLPALSWSWEEKIVYFSY